jgi:hypothetical protein
MEYRQTSVRSFHANDEENIILSEMIEHLSRPGLPATVSDAIRVALSEWKQRHDELEAAAINPEDN